MELRGAPCASKLPCPLTLPLVPALLCHPLYSDTIQASVVELRAINSQQHEDSSGDGGNGNGVAAAPRQPPSARALLRRGVAEAAAADALA